MGATAAVIQPETEEVRQARRAGELVETAVAVLREEVAQDGAMARAVERLGRVARALSIDHSPEGFDTAVGATHHALAHTLAIGRAIHGTLEGRGQQCLETLANAQRILYPVARDHGIDAPPPLPEPVPERTSGLPPDSWADRRASPRAEVETEISFTSDSNFYQGFSEDLSDGGVFVATYDLQPVGTKMDIEFTLPTGHIVKTIGEVRWLRQLRDDNPEIRPGMGVQFKQLLPEDEEAINAFLQARSPIFYDD